MQRRKREKWRRMINRRKKASGLIDKDRKGEVRE